MGGEVVVCPLHHHRFALLDGSCTTGSDDVAAYTVREENGELVIGTDRESRVNSSHVVPRAPGRDGSASR